MIIFESRLPDVPDVEIEASVSVAHVFQGDVLIQAGEDHLRMQVLGRSFRVSPTTSSRSISLSPEKWWNTRPDPAQALRHRD
jgi:hypothetical protein